LNQKIESRKKEIRPEIKKKLEKIRDMASDDDNSSHPDLMKSTKPTLVR
jgi:hypothetical protein